MPLKRSLWGLIISSILVIAPAFADEVGTLGGQAGVSPSGAATYTIPIQVPPALSGLQPSLALTYNSQARHISNPVKLSQINPGVGSMGQGWSISGLSAISRCQTDLTRDGYIDAVDYDSNDQFCLDGQRLILVSGSHGATGAEYKTEINGNAKVIVASNSGYGPTSFKVVSSNGQVSEYGYTNDSRQEAHGRHEIDRWNVNAIKDPLKNEISFHYSKNTTYLFYGISSITFDDKSIGFSYDSNLNLKHIKLLTNNLENYTYKFLYDSPVLSKDKKVTDVTKCAIEACAKPLKFYWNPISSSFHATSQQLGDGDGIWNKSRPLTGDVNGDGLTDLIFPFYMGSGVGLQIRTKLSNGDGTYTSKSQQLGDGDGIWNKSAPLTGDVNGDGLTDLIFPFYMGSGVGLQVRTKLSNGDGTFTSKSQQFGDGDGIWNKSGPLTGDVNGDGLTDLIFPFYMGSGIGLQIRTKLSNGDGTYTSKSQQLGDGDGIWNKSAPLAGDVNGDGLTDLIFPFYMGSGVGLQVRTKLSNGDGTFTSKSQQFGDGDGIWNKSGPLTGDVNGDGLTDLIFPFYMGSGIGLQIRTKFSNGDGTYTSKSQQLGDGDGIWNKSAPLTGDVNGDGLTDLIFPFYMGSGVGLQVRTKLSNGDGTFTSKSQQFGDGDGIWNKSGPLTGDVNGDGLADIIFPFYMGSGIGLQIRAKIANSTEVKSYNLISSAKNSFGVTSEFNYENKFTKGSYGTYPLVFGGRVSSITLKTSLNGRMLNSKTLESESLKLHKRGLGNLGFGQVTTTNNQTGIKTITEYEQDYAKRLIGNVKTSTTLTPTGVALSASTNYWESEKVSNGTHLIKLRKSLSQNKALDGSNTYKNETYYCVTDAAGCTEYSSSYDEYGNPLVINSTITDQQNGYETFTTQTTNEYWPLNSFATGNDYFTSQMKKVTVTKGGSNRDSKTRVAEFNEYYANGKLKKETVEPGANALFTQYEYETSGYGRITKKTVSGANITTRSSSITYDASNPYLSTSRNALNQTTVTELSPKWGTILSKTNANGLKVQHGYDDFGRKKSETLPDGTSVTYEYNWCANSSCPSGALYYRKATTTDGLSENYSKTYIDALQRKVAVTTLGFNGAEIRVDFLYDSLGRQFKTSLPYFTNTGSPVYKVNTGYDLLNRVTEVTHPNNTVSSIGYDGLSTTYTNAKNQQKVILKNAIGETISTTDDDFKQLSLSYDALGNLITTTDEANNSVIMNYDVRGNKTSMSDPDKGLWKYEYNVLGQLVLQTDAKNQSTCMSYDILGRMKKRIDNYLASNSDYNARKTNALNSCAGDASNQQYANWIYDTSPVKGIGKLHTVNDANGYAKTFTYDALGRVSNKAITIDGKTHNVSKTFYANTSKVDTMNYPAFDGNAFTVRNYYKATGALFKTQDVSNGINGEVYWQANTMNANGQLENFVLGNGVTTTNTYNSNTGFIEVIDSLKGGITGIQYLDYEYNAIGNLDHRKDFIKGLSEQFSYDEINRLTGSTITGTDAQGNAFREDEISSYDTQGLGNLQSKTGVGIYTYGQPNAACSVNFAGPHAVTAITGGTTQAATNYCYDENGDMVTGAGRTISYTAFGKPSLMSKGSESVEFIYGPNRTRTQRIDNNQTTTTYVEGIYEELETSGVLSGKYYIGNYAVVSKEAASSEAHYMHRDHLGSVDAITDANGVPVVGQQMSFDAWGKRRNATWNAMSTLELFNFQAQITKRGYTNHEQVDSMGLIHMGGRVYDPILARFISADPIIQSPLDMQSYNRYSYVRNNPLAYTDPTGYSWLSSKVKQFGDWAESESDRFGQSNNDFSNFLYASVAATFGPIGQAYGFIHGTKYSSTYRFSSNAIAGMADAAGCSGYCSAAVAGAQTYIMGGDLEDVAKSAAFAYVGSQMTMSFKGAKITGWQDIAKRSLYRGALGGTQSWANGGSFRVGFVRSAAIQGSFDSMQFFIESNNPHIEDGSATLKPGSKGVDLVKKGKGLHIRGMDYNNIGRARTSLEDAGFLEFTFEGSTAMKAMNLVPGMNYMAAFHDTLAGVFEMGIGNTMGSIFYAGIPMVHGTYYMQHKNNEYNLRNSAN